MLAGFVSCLLVRARTVSRKRFWALLLLISVFLASAVVFSVETLSPLQNVNVQVDGDNGWGFTSTGSDGIFKPLELGAGNYTVQISHEGYVSKTINATVTAGAETNLGDIELKTSGKIQGVVKDSLGNAVSYIQVLCQDESNNNTVAYAQTANDGTFIFETDIKNGTYTIQAIVSPSFGPSTYAGYASNMTTGIEATEGQTTSGVVVQLKPSGTILGTVKDKSDAPIENVWVSADPENNPGPLFFGSYATTNTQGAYTMDSNLPTGKYKVYISDAEGFVYSYLDYVNATVTAGQNTTVNFTLDHSGIISGAVNLTGGGPAPDTMVSAVSSDFKYYSSAQTDNSGLYRIESGLGTGQYTVMAANDYANMKTVNVTAGVETPNVDFQITRNLAWINGTVLNSTGGTINWGVNVEAVAEGVYANSYVDVDGRYSMEIQLPPGQDSAELNVTASAKGYFSSSQNVTVNREQTTSPVDFTLQMRPTGTLTGRVVAAVPYTPPRTVGVSVGNTFNHTVAFSWSSTDPNATIPPYFASLNDTEWISTSIIGVSGTSVTLQMTTHFKNGTDSTQVGITDITTGDGNVTNWVVAANLNPNDPLYTTGEYSAWKINETIVRTYPGGARNTNHLNMSTEINMTGIYQYSSINFYWDKSTGVMVEMSMEMVTQTNPSQTNMLATMKIVESNIWVIPEFPALTPALVVLILLTATVILYKRRLPRTLTNCARANPVG